jgi:F-box-like
VLYGVGPVSERVTIGSLPDDVLLDIFEFYQVAIDEDECEHHWSWEKLVHVCQRWRYLIFGSPKRLELYLVCTQKSPVRTFLDVWPPFPLFIHFVNDHGWSEWSESAEYISDNLVAALEHRDRVRYINITNSVDFLWERIVTAMEEPFPALKHLQLI